MLGGPAGHRGQILPRLDLDLRRLKGDRLAVHDDGTRSDPQRDAPAGGDGKVPADVETVVLSDAARAVVQHLAALVVEDLRLEIVLGMQADQLVAPGVVNGELVIAAAADRGIGFPAGEVFLVLERVGRPVFAVIDAAHD